MMGLSHLLRPWRFDAEAEAIAGLSQDERFLILHKSLLRIEDRVAQGGLCSIVLPFASGPAAVRLGDDSLEGRLSSDDPGALRALLELLLHDGGAALDACRAVDLARSVRLDVPSGRAKED